MVATRQRTPARDRRPVSKAGIIPARTREDFPQPDGPITARKRKWSSFSRSVSTWASRPKKMPVSSERNGRRPGYGAWPSRDGGVFIGTSSLQAGEEGLEITFIQAVGAVENT